MNIFLWNEYFLSIARFASTRSTCLAFPVGADRIYHEKSFNTGDKALIRDILTGDGIELVQAN